MGGGGAVHDPLFEENKKTASRLVFQNTFGDNIFAFAIPLQITDYINSYYRSRKQWSYLDRDCAIGLEIVHGPSRISKLSISIFSSDALSSIPGKILYRTRNSKKIPARSLRISALIFD